MEARVETWHFPCTAFNTDHFRAFIQLSWLGYTAVFPQNGAVGDRSGLGSTDTSNSRRSLSRTTVRYPEAAEYLNCAQTLIRTLSYKLKS